MEQNVTLRQSDWLKTACGTLVCICEADHRTKDATGLCPYRHFADQARIRMSPSPVAKSPGLTPGSESQRPQPTSYGTYFAVSRTHCLLAVPAPEYVPASMASGAPNAPPVCPCGDREHCPLSAHAVEGVSCASSFSDPCHAHPYRAASIRHFLAQTTPAATWSQTISPRSLIWPWHRPVIDTIRSSTSTCNHPLAASS